MILVLCLALSATATGQTLYGADGGAGNPACRLYTLDKATGAIVTNVGPIGYAICTLAFDPTSGLLYGCTGWRAALLPDQLFLIDKTTAVATPIGPTVSRVAGLTFDTTGQLFAWSEDGDSLYRINKATGASVLVGTSGIGTAGSGLIFTPVGELWVSTRTFAGEIHRISTTTGLPLASRAVSGSLFRTKALTADSSGTIYCVQRLAGMGGARAIATFDLATGVVTQVGATLPAMDAIAFERGSPPPTCAITAPIGGATVTGVVAITLNADDPQANPLTLTFEHSTDGGVTFAQSSPGPASPLANPATSIATPATGLRFDWDTVSDGLGAASAQAARLRITASDGGPGAAGVCAIDLMVDNAPLCTAICGDCNLNASPPDILDALIAAQIGVALLVPTPLQIVCCDVNASLVVEILDALLIAQASAGLAVTLSCP